MGLSVSEPALSQDSSNASAQANNPLASMTAFNMQDYYVGELTESGDYSNQFWFRYAQPFTLGESDWLLRASLPINTFPASPSGHNSGVGDANLFAAYLIDTGNPAISFGVGPQLTVPSASKDAVGSEKWSAGLVNVLFDARSPKFQWGYLLSWQTSFAGSSDREDVNVAALQPFLFYQLGGGLYLRAAPIWSYNLENDNYSVPVGIGIGKAVKKNKTVFNMFVEPQFSIADSGPGQPEWQIFVGLNLQFQN